jgi:hypothetical protein
MSWDPTDEWDSTPIAGGDFEQREAATVPDAIYPCEVVDYSIFRDKSGTWRVSWWFAIEGGVYDGASLQKFESFEGRTGWHKADLRTVLGRVPAKAELLDIEAGRTNPEIRRQVIGARVRVRQVSTHKGDKTFVDEYLNGMIARSPALDEPKTTESRPEPPARAPDRPNPSPDTGGTLPTQQTPAEGWGDPKCDHCRGKGCSLCVPY